MKLTLRDLFWLTLVVALALGWGVHSLRMAGGVQQLASENESYRSHIEALQFQLEREGYTIIHSSIGPFLKKNDIP